MILEKKSDCKYYCSNPDWVQLYLVGFGYRSENPGASHVVSRMRKARSIVITYDNGTVLIQGADILSSVEIFDDFCNQ